MASEQELPTTNEQRDWTEALSMYGHTDPDEDDEEIPSDVKDAEEEPIDRPARASRFFFRLTDLSDTEQRIADWTEKKQVESSTREIDVLSEAYTADLPKELIPHMNKVRDFLLKELSPSVLSANGGMLQAMQVMEQSFGEVDDTIVHQFSTMVHRATLIRLSRFLVKHMGLSKSDADVLVAQVSPKKEVLVVPQLAPPDQPLGEAERRPKGRR